MQTGSVKTPGSIPLYPSSSKTSGAGRTEPDVIKNEDSPLLAGDVYTGADGNAYGMTEGNAAIRDSVSRHRDIGQCVEALQAFTDAYNKLAAELDRTRGTDTIKVSQAVDELRSAIYKPVELNGNLNPRQISLYEVGVSHSANYREQGRLTVNESKFRAALENRIMDVAALFVKKEDGLLPRLQKMAGLLMASPYEPVLTARAFLDACVPLSDIFVSIYYQGQTT